MIGAGPTICTVCHVRAAPRDDGRFAFGQPNNSNQIEKTKAERQFTIEFPHDKHQNVIASIQSPPRERGGVWGEVAMRANLTPIPSPQAEMGTIRLQSGSLESHHRLKSMPLDDKKPNYNNCTICHGVINNNPSTISLGWPESFVLAPGHFKGRPTSHDFCFNCHWKNQKPPAEDCAGCHKASRTFIYDYWPKRISAKFSHTGGKGEHFQECTTCHINITRASTLRGLTPDVPIAACTACHKDNKKTTYPKLVTIEEEFDQYKKTGECTYCHTADVGKKKPPPSHDAAAQ